MIELDDLMLKATDGFPLSVLCFFAHTALAEPLIRDAEIEHTLQAV